MKINNKPETLGAVYIYIYIHTHTHTHTILIKNKKWNQQKRNKE